MLAYVFGAVDESKKSGAGSWESICPEEGFSHVHDLLAVLLVRGMKRVIRSGMPKAHAQQREELACVRGKIDLSDSIRERTLPRQRLVCRFDDCTTDMLPNRILKATLGKLLRHPVVDVLQKAAIRRLLPCFDEVPRLDLNAVDWKGLRLYRCGKDYRALLNMCEFVIKVFLPSTLLGKHDFEHVENIMASWGLYESFLREYYRKEHQGIKVIQHSFSWLTESGEAGALPVMKPDVILEGNKRICIIDAKFYKKNVCTPTNFYQIFAYVKNIHFPDSMRNEWLGVSGLLMYAKPEGEDTFGEHHMIDGHRIGFDLLDMGAEWSAIKAQLDAVPRVYLEMDKAESLADASRA